MENNQTIDFKLPDENILSRYQLFEVFKHLNQTITLINCEAEILYFNAQAYESSYKLFQKYPRCGQSIYDYLDSGYHERFAILMQRALAGEVFHVPAKLRNMNEQQFWFDYTFIPLKSNVGSNDAIAICSNDVTAQKVAEQKLIENEARCRAVIQDQTELICRYYPDGTITFVNHSYCDFFGASETDLLGKCWFTFVPEFIRGSMVAKLSELSFLKPINHYSQMVVDANGRPRWISCTDKAIFDKDGKVLEIQSVGKDITEQRMLEEAFQKTSRQFETILKAIPDPIFILDANGNVCDCFASNPDQLILPASDFINKNIRELFPEDICQRSMYLVKECLSTKDEQVFEYELLVRESKQFYESKYVCLEDNKVLAISRNITGRKIAEAQLKQSETMYKKLVDTSPDAVVIVTTDLRVLYVSPKTVQLFGCENKAELLGTEVKNWVDKDYYPAAENVLLKLLEEKGSIFNQCKLLRKNKDAFIGEINGTSIQGLNGKVWGFMLIVRDISLRLHFKYQVKLLHTAIERSPVSVIITDTNGKIEYVNKTFSLHTGFNSAEVIGKSPSVLKSGKQSKHVYEELWKTISSGNEWKGELMNRRKDGSFFWESAVIAPVRNCDGKNTHFIAVKEDITKRKAFEKELIDAKNKAEESDRLKSAFLANISHEIRTPMNGIIGFSNLLNEKNIDKESITMYTRVIVNECLKLLAIINDIVDISKIEAGLVTINKSPIELDSFLNELKTEFQSSASVKGISLRVINENMCDRLTLITDEAKLTQILSNLINNAIKYSDKGEVEFGYYIKNDHIEFVVKDNGIGISSEYHHVIFERFWQHESDKVRINEGMGLGLSISKSFIEKMGGKIWVESEIGKGATFYFSIPHETSYASRKKWVKF